MKSGRHEHSSHHRPYIEKFEQDEDYWIYDGLASNEEPKWEFHVPPGSVKTDINFDLE